MATQNNNATGSQLPPNISESLAPLTLQEQVLLDLYATVKSYERKAALAVSAATKAKLDAAKEKYQREQQQKSGNDDDVGEGESIVFGGDTVSSASSSKNLDGKKNRKRRNRQKRKDAVGLDENGQQEDDDNMTDNDEDENVSDSDEENDLHRRREEKLAKLRSERDLARQKKEEEEEAARLEEEMRKEHLAEDGTDIVNASDLGPTMIKKRRLSNLSGEGKKEASLLSNLKVATPPHEFSQGLKLSRVSGLMLFPDSSQASSSTSTWSPPLTASHPDDACLALELPDFESSRAAAGMGNNTIAIKFTAPSESKRFSINIAAPDHENYESVLFHFNPRQHQRGGQVVINDKQEGMWGQGVNVPLSTLPLMFGQPSCTLIVQINGDGFDIFLEDKHCARLEHRTPLPPKKCALVLQFPSTDDYGSPENWKIYKVWWGHKSVMAKGDLSNVAGVNTYDALHPKKLFISGLTKIHTEPEVNLRRAELERAFRKYGGQQGAIVTVPTNSTFAFVEVDTERQADLALNDMAGQYYRLSRARRSRHEALMEERAAAEASSAGINKETSDWD